MSTGTGIRFKHIKDKQVNLKQKCFFFYIYYLFLDIYFYQEDAEEDSESGEWIL